MAPYDVLLVGYGAVGVIYAYIMQRSELARVTVVARSNYEAAKNGHIVIESPTLGNSTSFKPYRVVQSVAEAADRPYKYVVVTTKALPDVLPTSKLLEPLLAKTYTHAQPTYALLQNGLGVEKDLYAKLSDRKPSTIPRVITCAVYIVANTAGNTVLNPGEVPRLNMGFYTPSEGGVVSSAEAHQDLEGFASLIQAGGGQANVVDNVQAAKFNKNLANVMLATTSGLTRVPVPFWLATPDVWAKIHPLLVDIGHEVVAVARALGFVEQDVASDSPETTLQYLLSLGFKADSKIKPSLLVDLEAGKSFELEVIIGEVLRAGQKAGLSTPLLEAGYTMLSVVQAYILRNPELESTAMVNGR
ncbi:hypothetical protein FRB94_000085 [Tulasnella sp. JGI-2019a]|nr:hypothetical protein FRB94_000085 [Tulasnella sp. JGI-2019a]